MIKKTTFPDGRIEEISGTPTEIAEYDREPKVVLTSIVLDECEKWRQKLEEGLQRGPQCNGWGIPGLVPEWSGRSVADFFALARKVGHDSLNSANDPECVALVSDLRKAHEP